MSNRNIFSGLVAAVVLSLAMVAGVSILSRALVRARTPDEMIRVVGSARKSIRSDFIIWTGSVTQSGPNVPTAYKGLQAGVERVKAYLIAKGIDAKEIVPAAVEVKTIFVKTKPAPGTPPGALGAPGAPGAPGAYEPDSENTFRPIAGYELSQAIEVRSEKVDKVDEISRQSTELISQGLRFESGEPMYLYTKLSDLKVSMQAEAAKDARARAAQIAESSNCRLGALRFARMNVPQITPLYSNEGDQGVDDTTSLDKKITAIVVAGYAIR